MNLLGNMPPRGRGVYARGQTVEWLSRFDFVALRASQGGASTKAIALRQRGVAVWFYDFPSEWMPDSNFVATVARFEHLISSTGAIGGIADPENGWVRPGATPAQSAALTKALKDSIGRGFRWGITSFASAIHTPVVAALAKSGAWGTPQLYHLAPSDKGWHAQWEHAFGARMTIPSVPVWHGDYPGAATESTLGPYLATLPWAPGAIAWTTDETSDAFVRVYLAWEPWGNPVVKAVLWLRDMVPTPLGLLVLAVLAAVVLAAFLLR